MRCNFSGEAAGEIWNWSLLGVKGLKESRCFRDFKKSAFRFERRDALFTGILPQPYRGTSLDVTLLYFLSLPIHTKNDQELFTVEVQPVSWQARIPGSPDQWSGWFVVPTTWPRPFSTDLYPAPFFRSTPSFPDGRLCDLFLTGRSTRGPRFDFSKPVQRHPLRMKSNLNLSLQFWKWNGFSTRKRPHSRVKSRTCPDKSWGA